ncbi:ABC transporter ATP-binding protein [Hathewaya massiliensis]|uniref:ABC transporter ATP-binding protein n=1 Tax=Hathewaya massiliensis TaxID=1964382 RepID=UPI0011591CC9|nr:ABC transporter ATP-binding protein [Hathewaya massiliensis]
MNDLILEGKNITVKIKEKTIIKDIDIKISKGEITSIIGPNGSGKTTLLKVLSRNIKNYEGEVFLDGKHIKTMNNKFVAKNMAYVSQNYNSNLDLTVEELVTYGRYAYKSFFGRDTKEDIDTVNWAMDRTKLLPFQHRKLSTLSGGERQRAWIAMSLAQKPKILLLDEPTTYLDICHQIELLELIKTLNEEDKLTVLMVLHDINQAARYSNRLFVIKEGRLIKSGCGEEIITEKNLKEIFNIKSKVFKREDTKKPYFYVLSNS